MAEDEEILKQVWDGKLPICFQLAQEELQNDDDFPPPFYLMVPRVTYFPLLLDKVMKQFSPYLAATCVETSPSEARTGSKAVDSDTDGKPSLPAASSLRVEEGVDAAAALTTNSCNVARQPVTLSWMENHVWLEFGQQPLKWHYPIGLLFDLFGNPSDLPWKITVHFDNYPTDILLPPPVNKASVEAYFMSTIKEADALKHRSLIVNHMQARDHRQLWTGLLNHRYDQFWAVNRRFMELTAAGKAAVRGGVTAVTTTNTEGDLTTDVANSDASTTDSLAPLITSPGLIGDAVGFRYIPCRLYHQSLHRLPFSAYRNAAVHDQQHRQTDDSSIVANENGSDAGTGAVVKAAPTASNSCLPMGGGYLQRLVRPYWETGRLVCFAEVISSLLTPPSSAGTSAPGLTVFKDCIFLVHGVPVPNEAPIQWISEHLSYPDNFVHIVARSRSS